MNTLKEEKHKTIKSDVTFGVIGHIDHGKTTLIDAIIDILFIDYSQEERKESITIVIYSNIRYKTANKYYSSIDSKILEKSRINILNQIIKEKYKYFNKKLYIKIAD